MKSENFSTILVLILAFAGFSGCATTERYNATLKTWVGRDVDSLIQKWGYPEQEKNSPNGNRVLIYVSEKTVTLPDYENPYEPDSVSTYEYNRHTSSVEQKTYNKRNQPPQTLYYSCTTFFEIKNNLIVRTSSKGNNCVE